MENHEHTYLHHFEEEDDLSFCNLPIGNGSSDSTDQESPRHSSYQEELFEFFNGGFDPENISITTTPYTSFFGKTIEEKEKLPGLAMVKPKNRSTRQQSGSIATTPTATTTRVSFEKEEKEKLSGLAVVKPKNRLTRQQSGSIATTPTATTTRGSYHNSKGSSSDYKLTVSNVQNVNITTLTSMSNKSRRKMFMFGPVKFMPEMEMSSIKERQKKLAPMTTVLSQVVSGGEKAVSGGGKAVKGRWGLLVRSWRSRSHMATIFSRSFGCIPVAGVERWIAD